MLQLRRWTVAALCAVLLALPASAAGPFNVGYRVVDLPAAPGEAEPLTVAVWYPTDAAPKQQRYAGTLRGNFALDAAPRADAGPYPLLVFSHGYGGGGLAQAFLAEPLAARGWIVIAPDHHDDESAVRIRGEPKRPLNGAVAMATMKKLVSSTPADRGDSAWRIKELKYVLDQATALADVGKLVDVTRIAAGGHSYGGFTALGVAGAEKELADPRIRALLVLSTGTGGLLYTKEELGQVKVPTLLFMGEKERKQKRSKRTMLELSQSLHDALPGPKYFLEVKGGTHTSFNTRQSDRLGARLLSGDEKQHDVIRRYAIAFLERYVVGDEAAGKALDAKDPMLSRAVHQP